MRPSDIRIPVGYPNDDPANGAGMGQRDYDDGQIGTDNLRTIAELRTMDTFSFLEPEFQRAYIGLCVAAKIEANLIAGVGTGWRSEATQAANHAQYPNQFSSVERSLHMRKQPRNVAYAIDAVPYDALNWLHANCARFSINFLDHIANERHHCQPAVLPNSGGDYNLDPDRYSALAAVRINIPYLGLLSVEQWLADNAPIELIPSQTTPAPTTPDLTEDDNMLAAIAKTTDGAVLAQFRFRGPVYTVGTTADHEVTPAEVFGRGAGKAFDIVSGKIVSWSVDSAGSWGAVKATKTKAQVRALMGV